MSYDSFVRKYKRRKICYLVIPTILCLVAISTIIFHFYIVTHQTSGEQFYDRWFVDYPNSECNYVETSREDSTYTKNGKITYTCSNCGREYIEYIPLKEESGNEYSCLQVPIPSGNIDQDLSDELRQQQGESALAAGKPEPTLAPTAKPTPKPTSEPTLAPTAKPTSKPTTEPTLAPTAEPTSKPTTEPTLAPTAEPTPEATQFPVSTINVISGTSFGGTFTKEKEEKEYSYTPDVSGKYRFDFNISDVNSGYHFFVYTAEGREIVSASYSDSGKTVELTAREKYTIKVCQSSGLPSYIITIGIPNQYSVINGEVFTGQITYTGQENVYLYMAPRTGRYRFDFVSNNGYSYRFCIYTSNSQELVSSVGTSYGGGETVDLTAGEQYIIKIQQLSGMADYTVTINIPNTLVMVEDDVFWGQITYVDQEDVYLYRAPRTGRYRFDFASDDGSYRFRIYQSNNKELASSVGDSYGGGETVDLTAGEQYIIRIQQLSGMADYMVTIGIPNVPVMIDSDVFGFWQGQLTYTDQEDIYMFIVSETGEYEFDFGSSSVSENYRFLMYTANNEEMVSISSLNQTYTVSLNAGEQYIIKIRQSSGTMDYTISYSIDLIDIIIDIELPNTDTDITIDVENPSIDEDRERNYDELINELLNGLSIRMNYNLPVGMVGCNFLNFFSMFTCNIPPEGI